MSNVQVKKENFNGDILVAAQENDSQKVYVGVKWVCEGIGLSEGQIKSERKKLQEDMVLKQGGRNLILPTSGGNQDVLCIELEFLPLWLAKISITPKMKKDSPETVEKLIEYQLKAKDVLANAFIHNIQQIIPKTYKEALIALVESIEKQEELEKENLLMKPKAESFDTFINGQNYQKMNDVAKALGYGRNKLYKFLRDKEILMKDNLPYQKYINNDYFIVKENPIKKGGYIVNHSQTFVSAKGVNFINKLLEESNIERVS